MPLNYSRKSYKRPRVFYLHQLSASHDLTMFISAYVICIIIITLSYKYCDVTSLNWEN